MVRFLCKHFLRKKILSSHAEPPVTSPWLKLKMIEFYAADKLEESTEWN